MGKRIFLFLGICAALTVPASADFVAYTITPTGNQYLYSFTLTNEGTTGLALHSLSVNIPIAESEIDQSSITSPAGWGPGGGGTFSLDSTGTGGTRANWTAGSGGGSGVGIGQSLGGFSFRTNTKTSGALLFDFGSENLGGSSPSGGLTQFAGGGGGGAGPDAGAGPALPGVPEPGSVILFALVGLALLARGIYEKRRRKAIRDAAAV